METNSPNDNVDEYLERWDQSFGTWQRLLKEERLEFQEYLNRVLGLRLQFGKQLVRLLSFIEFQIHFFAISSYKLISLLKETFLNLFLCFDIFEK